MKTGVLIVPLAASLAAAGVAVGASDVRLPVLRGTFVTTISGKAPPLNGRWTLKLDPPKFQTLRNGKVVIRGVAVATRGKMTLTDVSGSYACSGVERVGVYTYTLKAGKLTLKAVLDRCSGRKTVLTARPLTKV